MVMCRPIIQGVTIKSSKMTPQKVSDKKMPPSPEPAGRFLRFHRNLSLKENDTHKHRRYWQLLDFPLRTCTPKSKSTAAGYPWKLH